MKTTMQSRVRAYLAQRRALGFRLRSEGYLLLNFARYADRHARGGRLSHPLESLNFETIGEQIKFQAAILSLT